MAHDEQPSPSLSFFFYGEWRDDIMDSDYSHWRAKDILIDCISAKTAILYGYKMYQNRWKTTPFAIKTVNKNDYIIGRIISFNNHQFEEKLAKINEFKECKSISNQTKYSCVQSTVNVYLEADDAKTKPITAITYIKLHHYVDLKNCIDIQSNDWLKRNVFTTEMKENANNNRIESSKGGPEIYGEYHWKSFMEWKPNIVYKKGNIVAVDPLISHSNSFARSRHTVDKFALWAMCINQHESELSNKPQKYEIFEDLIMNISSYIRICLIEHVKGFNNELATIIISYCFKTNRFWWNGCYPNQSDDGRRYRSVAGSCGNLIAGIMSLEKCRKCVQKQTNLKGTDSDKNEKNVLMESYKGAIIGLNKEEGQISRKYVKNENVEEKQNELKNGNVILKTNIESDIARQKIYNLLVRNFNDSMEPLIKAAVNNDRIFVYKHNDKEVEVYIGKTNIWALYRIDDINIDNEELLCGLIWRFVHGPTQNAKQSKLMFEVLFLSTYEHVRHNRYGQKMVKQIECYCIENGYDIMTVAAVPKHGESFWQSNGFKMEFAAPNNNITEKRGSQFLRQNMLVFDDTPLFSKDVHHL